MTNMRRKLGINIFTLMQQNKISHEKLAKELNYTTRDVYRILEGKLMIPPVEIKKIANFFGKTKQELLEYDSNKAVPELQYMKEFSDEKNLDTILDLLDDYVTLKEYVK